MLVTYIRASRHHVIPIHPLYAYTLAMQILRNVVIIHIHAWIQPTDLADNWQLFTLFPHLLDQLDLQRLDVPVVKKYLYAYQQRGGVPLTLKPEPWRMYAHLVSRSCTRRHVVWLATAAFLEVSCCVLRFCCLWYAYIQIFFKTKRKGQSKPWTLIYFRFLFVSVLSPLRRRIHEPSLWIRASVWRSVYTKSWGGVSTAFVPFVIFNSYLFATWQSDNLQSPHAPLNFSFQRFFGCPFLCHTPAWMIIQASVGILRDQTKNLARRIKKIAWRDVNMNEQNAINSVHLVQVHLSFWAALWRVIARWFCTGESVLLVSSCLLLGENSDVRIVL